MTAAYSLSQYVEDLRRITRESDDEDQILAEVGPLARRFALDGAWLKDAYYQANPEQGFGVHLLHEEPDHSLAVFAVSWLPGRGTPPHDHGTWAVVCGIEGIERNIRYKRIDDGAREGHAELAVKHDFKADRGDLVCMKTGGIHEVRNETDAVTLSLHTYGRHVNYTERAQYDLEAQTRTEFKVKVE